MCDKAHEKYTEPPRGQMILDRSKSMTRAYEFARVRTQGISSPGRFLVVSLLEDSRLESSRFGIITTKKVGKAHTRNLLRRRVRDILRSQGDCVSSGHYVVTVLRWRAFEASYEELEKDWLRAYKRIKRGEGRLATNSKSARPNKSVMKSQ